MSKIASLLRLRAVRGAGEGSERDQSSQALAHGFFHEVIKHCRE
jgi:hypothetical protein